MSNETQARVFLAVCAAFCGVLTVVGVLTGTWWFAAAAGASTAVLGVHLWDRLATEDQYCPIHEEEHRVPKDDRYQGCELKEDA